MKLVDSRRYERRSAPGRIRRLPWWRMLRGWTSLGIATAVLAVGSLLASPAAPAEALPRGEVMTFPGGVVISNFVMPNGTRAYCVEIEMGEPTGRVARIGAVSQLPERKGIIGAWSDPAGMRQMNYLISTHGQKRDALTTSAVQLTIWRMRANFKTGNQQLNRTISALEKSSAGRKLIALSDKLIADARANAKPPKKAEAITAQLKIVQDPAGRAGRYQVSFPKGATALSVKNGVFARNGKTAIEVPGNRSGMRNIDIVKPGAAVSVTGRWASEGARGWNSTLELHNSWTAAGAIGQRIAVATGKSDVSRLVGRFPAVSLLEKAPKASSQAQPSAEVGGTMTDTLIVRAEENTVARIWPGAVADFTAYLQPEPGAVKFDSGWNPILGDEYEAQAEDPATGEPLWDTWWAAADGEALLDGDGRRIPVVDDSGTSTAGTAADGTAYPVQKIDGSGAPVVDETGNPVYLTVREPVLEKRRDPVTWTKPELDAMSEQQKCTAQPVHSQTGIRVSGLGRYTSEPAVVKSGGVVHWVERVVDGVGTVVHKGKCGLASETTKIGLPAVVTEAQPEAEVGESVHDVARVSGRLARGAHYSLRFEAYAAVGSKSQPDADAPDPVCNAENRIFRSDVVPVPATGEYRSPEFTVRSAHGERIWWVESLLIETEDGAREIHRGECGLENETTAVTRPSVETVALEQAVTGDHLVDTAVVDGALRSSEDTRWELVFETYSERYAPDPAGAAGLDAHADRPGLPVCEPENRLFETKAVPVVGPGQYVSPAEIARPEWNGKIWWVETLWLIEGDERTPVHRGECGLANETTEVKRPEVVTEADAFVALGGRMTDTAMVEGALSSREGVTHEVVFEGYRGHAELTGTDRAVCEDSNRLFTTDAVRVSAEEGTLSQPVESPAVTALPEFGETVWWVETLYQREGEELREIHRGECGVEGETTALQSPEVRTESAGAVMVGEEMYDTAIIEGPLDAREGLEYRVRFTAYERIAGEPMRCTKEHELPAFEDAVGVSVTGPGRYESKRVVTEKKHVGLGGYVETLVMIEDGEEHIVHTGECGASDEEFSVTPAGSPTKPTGLADTGGTVRVPLLLVGAGVLVAGVTVLCFARRPARTLRADARDPGGEA